MKKQLLLLSCIILGSSHIFAQIPYYDAIALSGYLGDNGKGKMVFPDSAKESKEWARILAKYDPDLQSNSTVLVSKVIEEYTGNPFLKEFLPEGRLTSQSESTKLTSRTFLSSIGGVDVTTFTEGLAKFLVERAKEELNIAFFRRFKEDLESPEYQDLRALFPETYRMLLVIGSEFYNYAPYVVTLREAFKKDLTNLLDNLRILFNSSRYTEYFQKHPELLEIFNQAIIIINGLSKGEHPGEILNEIANIDSNAIDTNLHNGIKLLNVFSISVKSTDPDRYWISSESLNLLQGNTLIIFMGLIYQQVADEIYFTGNSGKVSFKDLVPKSPDKIKIELAKYQRFIREFVYKATIVDANIREIVNTNPGDITYKDYHRYFSAVINLFEQVVGIEQILQMEFDLTSKTKQATNTISLVSDIYQDINANNYGSAIFNSAILLDSVLSDNFKYRREIIKYGSFMAAVVNAENGDEISAAIEAIALPPGSASIKRQTISNIALNAYVGVTAGSEYLYDLNNSKGIMAVYSPVGVAFSWGMYRIRDKNEGYNECGAITIFVSLIDIGAVTTYRFSDPESEALPEIKFQNILAPGINIIYGFAGSPVSIGLGGQFGPALRKITGESSEIRNGVNYRIHAFLAVDIPLLNFHNNPR